MKHLTSLKELSKDEILELLDLADNFIDSEGFIRRDPLFPDKKVINIFCEPSTRTKISFEIAASNFCLLYTSPSPRDKRQSRMPSSA